MIRTYRHSGAFTNAGKREKLFVVSRQYRTYFNTCIKSVRRTLFSGATLPKYLPRMATTLLSERYKQTCGGQARATFLSWLSNVQNRFRYTVLHSSLDDGAKHRLLTLNKTSLWFSKDVTLRNITISQADLKLARRIFKQVRGRSPAMKNPSMLLDRKVAKLEPSTDSTFDGWIRISTLEKGHPVCLPIKGYNYCREKTGELQQSVQVIVDLKAQTVDYGIIKDVAPTKTAQTGEHKVVGLDLGIVELINTSTGNKYGLTLYPLLKKYDRIIQRQIKGRMCAGLMTNSPWIAELHAKVAQLIKNEVGRALNKLIEQEAPSVLVIENLTNLSRDTRKDPRLSKTMRRLLSRCGISQVRVRILQKCEEHGIDLVQVNPAYTSQECQQCHHVEAKNRKRKAFRCLRCGKKTDADYNGSVNVLNRRSVPQINIYTPYRAVKGILAAIAALSSRHHASDREAVPFGAPNKHRMVELLL